MKYLLAQPMQLRFLWEVEVALTNILSLDKETEIVCLFVRVWGEDSDGMFAALQARYPTVEMHLYNDSREDKSYPPTVRPHLWVQYLSEDPAREKDTYFQIDSDVIFRELPDFNTISPTRTTWYGSDCAGYIDYQYLKTRQNGEEIVDNFARIIGVPRSVIEETPGVGAHWVLVEPSAEYWRKVQEDCDKLWHYLEGVESDIQKWTAEMWAQLYNGHLFGVEHKISSELDFCRPTDDIKMWDITKILHNAGVLGELASQLFYKGKYVFETPFGADLSFVRRDKAGIKYAEAIEAVKF